MLQTKKLLKLKNPLKTLEEPTKVCKLCFKKIQTNNLFHLFNRDYSLCQSCYKKLKPEFVSFEINSIKALAIYRYDEEIKSLIYQFKGCYDYELKDIFLERFKNELKVKYYNFIMVPVPSYYLDDKKREFNHVIEIFKILNLPMEKLIYKTGKFKQAEHTSKGRELIEDYLDLLKVKPLNDKNILIVDDVFTTGSTIRACINLIKKLKPKKIEVLVIAKTFDR